MTTAQNATGERAAGEAAGTNELPALLDVDAVARLLACSARHVYRLADAGRMPRPVKLGSLVRWPRQAILKWIEQGCPPAGTGGRP